MNNKQNGRDKIHQAVEAGIKLRTSARNFAQKGGSCFNLFPTFAMSFRGKKETKKERKEQKKTRKSVEIFSGYDGRALSLQPDFEPKKRDKCQGISRNSKFMLTTNS